MFKDITYEHSLKVDVMSCIRRKILKMLHVKWKR